MKTSNPGSGDLQDLKLANGDELYLTVARLVHRYAVQLVGQEGYSAIGAVVGATYPAQAEVLRNILPKSIFLVPGYGAQGATSSDVVPCFNSDGLGAVVNASRSLTYAFETRDITEYDFSKLVRERTLAMINDITSAIAVRIGSRT